jgi:hypothetical protein
MPTVSTLDITERYRPKVIADARQMHLDGRSTNDITVFLVRKGVPINSEQVRVWRKKQPTPTPPTDDELAGEMFGQ